MKPTHIRIEIISAQPMTRSEWFKLKESASEPIADPEDDGFLLEVVGGEAPPNITGRDGYATWASCKTFEQNLYPLNAMDFGTAVAILERGYKLARKGWNGNGMFIFLVPGSTFRVNRPPLLGIYPEGTEIKYRSHIDMKTADGSVVPWVASQTDILARDWEMVA